MAFYLVSGGGYTPTLEVVCPTANGRAYGTIICYDTSNYNQLKIGRCYKAGTGNITNTQFKIRDYVGSGTSYVYEYRMTDDEQVFDISAFNEFAMICDFKSNVAWTGIRFDNVTFS